MWDYSSIHTYIVCTYVHVYKKKEMKIYLDTDLWFPTNKYDQIDNIYTYIKSSFIVYKKITYFSSWK